MKIRQNSISYNQNKSSFKAVPIAKIRMNGSTIKDEITIFKLTEKDIPFLKKMSSKLNIQKLYKKAKDTEDIEAWKEIINNAIGDIELKLKGLLAVRNNKPAGIMSYLESDKKGKVFYISHFAVWPVKAGESTHGTGKSLIRQELQECKDTDKLKTFLIPSYIKPGNKDCHKFYHSVGFTETPAGLFEIKQNPDEKMNIFDHACKTLDELMSYKKIPNGTEINLNEHMDINYTPGLTDKIKNKINSLIKN